MRKYGLPLAVAALLVSSLPTLAADEASSEPVAETVHGWPGTRRAPAGLYSWEVAPTNGFSGDDWMHKIPKGYAGDCCAEVQLTFYAGTPLSDVLDIEAVGANYGWGAGGPFDRPARMGSTEMWLLDVEGTRVAIMLDSYAGTDPALVEEARAVIESIVVEPTETGHRLVFRLEEGWDSG